MTERAAMTEDEARTKWCPFVRLADGGREYFDNRGRKFGGSSGMDGADASKCIGSACMAWRWFPNGHMDRDKITVQIGPDGEINNVAKTPAANWRGYCGLAGKP